MTTINPLPDVVTVVPFWLAFLAKGSLILLAASIASLFLRKTAASLRHNIWLAALCAALLMPLAQLSLPAWRPTWLAIGWTHNSQSPATLPAAASTNARAPGDRQLPNRAAQPMLTGREPSYQAMRPQQPGTPAVQAGAGANGGPARRSAARFNPLNWLLLLWALGAALLILRRLRAEGSIRTFVRPSAPADTTLLAELDKAKAEIGFRRSGSPLLLLSGAVQVPCTLGFFSPAILLPVTAVEWSMDRLHTVLLHELAHVRRLDCLWLLIGQMARALYWPNPLAWLATSQLRSTCEEACDNCVLRCGRAPTDYADDLVAIAGSLQSRYRTQRAALAMARPSTLKYRVLAILDQHRNRRAIAAPALAAIVFLTSICLVFIGSLHAGNAAPGASGIPAPSTIPSASAHAVTSGGKQRMLHLVITGQTGRRIGGAKVSCTLASDRSYWIPILTTFRGTADSQGRIAVPIPHNRLWPYAVHVQAPHHVRILVEWRPKPFNKPIKVPSHLRVILPRGTKIGGIVLGPHGNPAVGVHVFIVLNTGQRLGSSERLDPADINVISNADGKWSCDQAPVGLSTRHGWITVGTWSRRFVTHTGNHRTQLVKPLTALREGSLILKLQRGVKINGTIVGPDGQPLADAKVGLGDQPEGGFEIEPPPMATDSLGRFSWVAQPGKLVTLTAWAPHCAPQTKMFKMGTAPKSVSFHLEPGRTVRGQVLDSSGKPIGGVVLSPDRADDMGRGEDAYVQMAWMPALLTNSAGWFTWHHAPPGTLQFDVTNGGCATLSWAVEPTSQKPRATLYPPVRVRGTVTDEKTGNPIKKFTVILGTEFISEPPAIHSTFQFDWPNPPTMHNGKLKFNQYYAYRHTGMVVLIQAPGYKAVQSTIFHRSQALVDMHFALARAANIVEQIINSQGRPVAGATAVIVQSGPLPASIINGQYPYLDRQRTTTSAKGYLRFPPQRGKFRLLVLSRHGYADLRENQLPKSGVIRLIPWAKIIGHLTVGGKPVARWPVTSGWFDYRPPGFNSPNPEIWMSSQTRSDRAGNFVLERIPAGKVQVSMYRMPVGGPSTAGIPNSEIKSLNIQPGQVVHVSLSAPK